MIPVFVQSARDEVDILRDHVAVEQLKAQTARGEMLEIVDRLDMVIESVQHSLLL